ncbi:MAG: hypothetical protein Q6364_03975, partial [Candidatus Hermodarchaeota archaeon]|nr:hypothetical protein [Candidatus Hermodarchaeota archaeon]
MTKCSVCGEEIIGNVYSRVKYKWQLRMFVPVNYCKYCYLENQENLEGAPPAFITFFPIFAAVMVILLMIVG